MSKISAKTRYVQLMEWLATRPGGNQSQKSQPRRFNRPNNRTRR